MSNAPRIVYTPCTDSTPEDELNALAAVYRFLLLEKGGRHDLTKKTTTEAEGVRQDKEGKDSNVCC